HSLARIYTDGGAEAVGELARHSRGLVDVPVKGQQRTLFFEELPHLAGAHVRVAVDQIERRPMRGTVKRAHQGLALRGQLLADGLEIASDPLFPFPAAEVEGMHRAVRLTPEPFLADRTSQSFLPPLPIFECEGSERHGSQSRDPGLVQEGADRAMDVMETLDPGALEHGKVRAPVVVPHDVEDLRGILLAPLLADELDQESLIEGALLHDRRVRREIPSQDDGAYAEAPRERKGLHVELPAPVEIGRVEDVGSRGVGGAHEV